MTGRTHNLWMLRTLAGISLLSTIITTIFLIIIGSSFIMEWEGPGGISIAAAVLEFLSLVVFAAFVVGVPHSYSNSVHSPDDRRSTIAIYGTLAISGLAGVFTIAVFTWTTSIYPFLLPVLGRSAEAFAVSFFCFWAFSAVAKAVFFIIIMTSSTTNESLPWSRAIPLAIDYRDVQPGNQPVEIGQPLSVNPFNRNPASPPKTSEGAATINSVETTSTMAMNPMSSKTRLISNPSFANGSTPTRVSEDSAFSWSDGPSLRDSLPSNPTFPRPTITTLAPIPGSRPASPAKALEGPFPERPLTPELPPTPTYPTVRSSRSSQKSRPSSPHGHRPSRLPNPITTPSSYRSKSTPPSPDSTPTTPSSLPPPLPNTSRTSTMHSRPSFDSGTSTPLMTSRLRGLSSSQSLTEDYTHLATPPAFPEDNIHPLFRSSSPTPAPSVKSAGTVVTAAPPPAGSAIGRKRVGSTSGGVVVPRSPLADQVSFFPGDEEENMRSPSLGAVVEREGEGMWIGRGRRIQSSDGALLH